MDRIKHKMDVKSFVFFFMDTSPRNKNAQPKLRRKTQSSVAATQIHYFQSRYANKSMRFYHSKNDT